jgi:long-chain acyl-CoA synthetase
VVSIPLPRLDPDALADIARQHGLQEGATAAEIIALDDVRRALDNHLAEINAGRPTFEQVKKLELLPEELSVEAGTLTPTLKVKRRAVGERYADLIRDAYA